MSPRIPELFDVVQMNASRTTLVYAQTLTLADERGDDRLRQIVERGIAAADEVRRLDAARKVQRQGRADAGGDDFDTAMDDAVRPLVRSLSESSEYMRRTDHPARARLARLAATHFPGGLGDIISQRYEEELFRVQALIADLRGPYADLLDELEVERKLARVEALVAPYADALAARRQVTGAEVREASRVMNTHTLMMVAHVVATYGGDPEAFEAVLLPFSDQQARIRAILRARRTTGAVSDDPSRDDDDVRDVEGEVGDAVDGAEGADAGDGFDGFEGDEGAAAGGADGAGAGGAEDRAGGEADDGAAAEGGEGGDDDPNAGREQRGDYWYDELGQGYDAEGYPVVFDNYGRPIRVSARVPIATLPRPAEGAADPA